MRRPESSDPVTGGGVADRPLRISVIGAGEASPEECRLAATVGRVLAEAGAIVVTGGLAKSAENFSGQEGIGE